MAQHQRTYKRLQRARPDFDEQCSVVSYLVRHLDVISGDEFFLWAMHCQIGYKFYLLPP